MCLDGRLIQQTVQRQNSQGTLTAKSDNNLGKRSGQTRQEGSCVRDRGPQEKVGHQGNAAKTTGRSPDTRAGTLRLKTSKCHKDEEQ